MSLKTEEPAVDVLALFPKDADTKPKVGEIQPSGFFKFEADMSCALSKIAPIGANVPRRLGMRQLFAEETDAEPIKDNSKKEILEAWARCYNELRRAGFGAVLQQLSCAYTLSLRARAAALPFFNIYLQ